jgi:DNA-binding transcriptional LysR family regulator
LLIYKIDMKLTLRQLEIFTAIARTENVSQAAVRLAMSQSAASSALVEVERMYDCPLFDRIGKSLHLNSTGRGLLPMAEALLAQAREVEDYLSGGQPGPLSVGATLTIGNYLATLIVVDYMRQFPGSPVQLHVANSDTVVDRLLRFECDFGLIEGELAHPELNVEPWLDDELVVFCAPGHVLAGCDEADDALLSAQTWILREPGSGTRSQFDRCIGSRLSVLRLGLELEHTEAIKRTVESGLGLGCLSRLALREAFRRGSLVEVQTPQFDLRRHFYFATHRSRNLGTAGRLFRQACLSASAGADSTAKLALPFIP